MSSEYPTAHDASSQPPIRLSDSPEASQSPPMAHPAQSQPPPQQYPPAQGYPPPQQYPPSQGYPPPQQYPPSQGYPPPQQYPPSQGYFPAQQYPPSQAYPPSQQYPPTPQTPIAFGPILGILGSLLALFAFFLPWLAFGSVSLNGLDIVSYISVQNTSTTPIPYLILLEPVMGILTLTAASFAARRNSRGFSILQLLTAFIGLIPFGYLYYVLVQDTSQATTQAYGSTTDVFVSPSSLIGVGFWLALVGFVGALLGGFFGPVRRK